MAKDPYQVLGVAKDASQVEVQKAYRRLAKKLHPDLNPGDKAAEAKFKELSAAYDIVGDAAKRARFDKGEIDASGAERPPERRFYRDFAEAGPGRGNAYASDEGFADLGDAEDFFTDLFGRGARARGTRPRRGADMRYRLELDFLDAFNGAKRTLTLPTGDQLDVTIPPGTGDGQVLRLRGKGEPGFNGGPDGDALLEISVRPHPAFERRDDDVHVEVALPLKVAVLGGRIEVPTPSGPVAMTVPKWTSSGRTLRLKGRGAAKAGGGHGDQYVTLTVALPATPDPALEDFMRQWKAGE